MTQQYRIASLAITGDEVFITLADPASGRQCSAILPAALVHALDTALKVGDMLSVSDDMHAWLMAGAPVPPPTLDALDTTQLKSRLTLNFADDGETQP